MVTSTGETTQPDTTLSEQLGKLQHLKNESQATFLARAAGIAAEYPDIPLSEEDLTSVSDVLHSWQFSSRRLQGVIYGVAQRTGYPVPLQKEILDDYHVPERRLVSTASNNIMVLAKKALDGSDLACIFEIEQAGAQYKPPKPKPIAPKRVKPPRKRPVPPKPKAVKPAESEANVPKLQLNEDQQAVIRLLALHPAEIAYKLEIVEETVASRITRAMDENNINRQELLTRSIQENRIDLDLLPHPQTYTLTDREKEVLTRHSFATLAETAQAMLISQSLVSSTWTHIYNKLGASLSNRTDAFLIAKRDGVF